MSKRFLDNWKSLFMIFFMISLMIFTLMALEFDHINPHIEHSEHTHTSSDYVDVEIKEHSFG